MAENTIMNLQEIKMTKRTSTKYGFKIALGLLIVTAVMITWHYQVRPYHFRVVQPDRVYRSGCLDNENLEKVVEQYRIRTIVALNRIDDAEPHDNWYADEKKFCQSKSVRFVHTPLLGNKPPSPDQLQLWLSVLDDPGNYPVLVHCAQGVVRTGMFVAVYNIEYMREDNCEVLQNLPMFGHHLYTPKRKEMREFILNYDPRWKMKRTLEGRKLCDNL